MFGLVNIKITEVLLFIGLIFVLHNLLLFFQVVVYLYETVLLVYVISISVLVLYYTTMAFINWINKTFEEDKIL